MLATTGGLSFTRASTSRLSTSKCPTFRGTLVLKVSTVTSRNIFQSELESLTAVALFVFRDLVIISHPE